jgi:hypothetical protein
MTHRSDFAVVVFHVFEDPDQLDWRSRGQALPAGATPVEVTWGTYHGPCGTVVLHGYDEGYQARVVETRNAAISDLASFSRWGD